MKNFFSKIIFLDENEQNSCFIGEESFKDETLRPDKLIGRS